MVESSVAHNNTDTSILFCSEVWSKIKNAHLQITKMQIIYKGGMLGRDCVSSYEDNVSKEIESDFIEYILSSTTILV